MLKYLSLLLFAASAVAQPFPARPGPVIISQPSTGGSSSSGGVDTNAVIALIEQYGGGGITSNTVVELVVDTWYTNGADAVIVEAQVELNNASALMIFSVKDTNSAVAGFLPGSAAWNEFGNASKYAFANITSPDVVQSLGGYVPAYAAFRYYASGTTAALYQNAPNGTRLVYFGAGSGGEGSVSTAEVAAIMLTNSALGLVFTNTLTRWVDTNGNDANPGTFAQPWRTPTNAVARVTTPGAWIMLNPGVYNVGTNQLRLAHGVNLGGAGEILSSIDLNAGGVALNPGSESIIQDITITCDTNTVYTRFDASTHSGYWAAVGVAIINGAEGQAFTNAVVRNVMVKNASTDIFYWWSPTNAPSSLKAFDCRLQGFFDVVAGEFSTANTAETNTTAEFYNCHFEVTGVGAHPDITFGQGALANIGKGTFSFISCTGVSTNGVIPASATFFAGTGNIQILGGKFESKYPLTGNTAANGRGVSGSAVFNSTNLVVGNLVIATNVNPLLNTLYTNGPGQAQFYGSFNFSGGGDAVTLTGVTYSSLNPPLGTNFWSRLGVDDSAGSSFVVLDLPMTFPVGPNEVFYLQTSGTASLITITTNNWKLVVK